MSQIYSNNLNIPDLVSTFENNIDKYNNENVNSYVPINKPMVYNPNIELNDISSNNQMNPNNNQMNPNNNQMNNPMNQMNNQMNNPMNQMNNSMNQMNNPINNQMNNPINNPINNQMNNSMNNSISNYNDIVPSIENLNNNNNMNTNKKKNNKSFLQLKLLKQISIYTVLFLIFSHSKMNEIIDSKIPLIGRINSNIPLLSLKGFFMAILVILINYFLGF